MDTSKINSRNKWIFIIIVLISLLLIFIYNVLTPMITDDFSYTSTVREAKSIWDLFVQEKKQYLNWNGRSINHIILRLFLYSGNMILFKVCNSIVFVMLSLLIYANIYGKKQYDVFTYIVVQLLLWFSVVSFGQTILWETGACNYLWGTTIILGFVTFFRKSINLKKDLLFPKILLASTTFLFGLIAGWCNENTSGGGIIIIMIFLIEYYLQTKRTPPIWSITGLIAMFMGLIIMIAAPGNRIRSAAQEETHSGVLALVSRMLKCTLKQKELFFILFSICIVTFIVLMVQKRTKDSLYQCIFFVVSLCTSYALVLTTEPTQRAYFGAGIFLIIATVQGITNIGWEREIIRVIKISGVSICLLYFCFHYLENGANLMRISRDYSIREEYIMQCIQDGEKNIIVPTLRKEFDTKYSDAIQSDMHEDAGYWINTMYATYYNAQTISAVNWDDWEERLK